MDDRMTDLLSQATEAGIANFTATSGRVPDSFQLLMKHHPAAFAGYGLIRSHLMADTSGQGGLDLKTKEFIYVLLDVLRGDKNGALSHAGNAIRLGVTARQMAEGLVQVIMVGGINTWNMTGQEVMRLFEPPAPPAEREAGEGGGMR
jgi:alkylhydroperoxidase/carboxymuconolactone decarboxylase family protein YurZ